MSWRAGIHGYAAKWGEVTSSLSSRPNAPDPLRPVRFERDCFSYDAASVEIWFMHRQAQAIGFGGELGLQIWPDAYGLAFAFTPPRTAWSIVAGVSDGRYDRCSAGFSIEAMTLQQQGGVAFDSISRAWLREISICPLGACPGAVCWHAAAEPWALRPHAARLISGWEQGRLAAAA